MAVYLFHPLCLGACFFGGGVESLSCQGKLHDKEGEGGKGEGGREEKPYEHRQVAITTIQSEERRRRAESSWLLIQHRGGEGRIEGREGEMREAVE